MNAAGLQTPVHLVSGTVKSVYEWEGHYTVPGMAPMIKVDNTDFQQSVHIRFYQTLWLGPIKWII